MVSASARSSAVQLAGPLKSNSTDRAVTLGQIVNACRDDIRCPYLVHMRPTRPKPSREKTHLFQLSDGFAAARDACGLFNELPPGEKPSFHELLALGE